MLLPLKVPSLPPPEAAEGMGRTAGDRLLLVVKPLNHRHRAGGEREHPSATKGQETMFQIRKANQRGHVDHGWLNAHHTFSFAGYHDAAHMGFRSLRVMNEDRIGPGQGFGTHPHRDMEIVTYVLEGALQHRDSMGNGEVLTPGEFQRMSAGSGITHSEFNPSPTEPVHLYQIWLQPRSRGIDPSYEQKRFDDGGMTNQLRLVAAADGAEGALKIHQDTRIYLAKLDAGRQVEYQLATDRHVWLQVLRGTLTVNGHELNVSDGAAISAENHLEIISNSPSELMLFDLN
jgi:redox-sensitive bicupin YhaK (pirin superfamily)